MGVITQYLIGITSRLYFTCYSTVGSTVTFMSIVFNLASLNVYVCKSNCWAISIYKIKECLFDLMDTFRMSVYFMHFTEMMKVSVHTVLKDIGIRNI